MSNPDQTLAAIDDVLAGWESGPDAMVWTAAPPEAAAPAGPAPRAGREPGPAYGAAGGGVGSASGRSDGGSSPESETFGGRSRAYGGGSETFGGGSGTSAGAVPGGRAARPVAVMLTQGFAVWARSPAVRRMIAFAQSLEGQAVAEVCGRRGDERGLRPCLCLCATRHRGRAGICDGEAVGTHPHESLTTGLVEVPMCRPCLSADRPATP
ncbi:hypothetical protein ABZT47_39925 [Sphaerisporangium sp. NPDC005289]|uniref:hypothetical protein n=1 Tax=Sphaerisporangium sp. NPDC005289 TaxID=3155247 RepID=UPI0033BDAA74